MSHGEANDLESHFGDYESNPCWESEKSLHPPESDIAGVVVARAAWGVYLDISSPFPGVLLATRMSPRPDSPEDLPEKGERVFARISHHANDTKQIVLKQDEK